MSAAQPSIAACPPSMTIRRAGDGIAAAPAGMASGPFLVQTILASQVDGEMTAMRVYLDPGVVSHWHRHPRGQMLFVLDGVGLVQSEGVAVIEVRAGDSVWFAPDERHWHGAGSGGPFSYVSVQAVGDGAAVRWMEPVQ